MVDVELRSDFCRYNAKFWGEGLGEREERKSVLIPSVFSYC